MKAAGLIVLTLVLVFSGAAGLGALADVSGVEEPAVSTEAEDQTRQDSAGIRITMTGRTEDDRG